MKRKVPSLQFTTRPGSRQETTQFSPQNTMRITQISPRLLTSPNTARHLKSRSEFQLDEKPIPQLKKINKKARQNVDSKVFWGSVMDYAVQQSLKKPEPNFNKEKQTKLYAELMEMKRQKEARILREKQIEEERKLTEAVRLRKLAEEEELKSRKEIEQNRLKTLLAEKYKIDRRFTFYNVVNASMFKLLHSKHVSFRLAKLISKHWLNLLNYKGIERRITEASHAPLILDFRNSIKPINHAIQIAQIKEIQQRLNDGLILRKKQTTVLLKQKKQRESIKASDHFSPPVLKRIRFLQSCLRLKVFRTNKKNENKPIVKTDKRNIYRVKAQKKILDDINFQNQSSPKSSMNGSPIMLQTDTKTSQNPLGLFSTIQKAAAQLKNYQRVKSEKMIQRTNEFLVKQVQFLYYPIIRYVSAFYHNVVVWSISYQDITIDRTCIVLHFKGEGKYQYFYRLDIPIGSLQKLDQNSKCITVWPTVEKYLISYLESKGQLALWDEEKDGGSPVKYKLNFIQGLSVRSRRKINQEDIDAIVKTKSLLNYLQTSQIVRVRKIFGSVYELLPQFKDWADDEQMHYIINLPLVHDIILEMRTLESNLMKRRRNVESTTANVEQYKAAVNRYYQHLNQILCFRFVHNNVLFFKDQMLQTMNQIQNKSVYIQCSIINIQELLNQYDFILCQQLSPYCLLSMNIIMNHQHNLDILLFDVISKQPKPNTTKIHLFNLDEQKLQWKFKQEYFSIQIEATLFEKDQSHLDPEFDEIKEISVRRIERNFKILEISIENFVRLSQALQETKKQYLDEKCDFDKTLKNIIFESNAYSNLNDLVIKNAFTLNLKTNEVIIQNKYLHILSKTHNFIQKMDHQSLYNKVEYIQKYSVFPNEEKVLRSLRKKTQYVSQKLEHSQQFNKFFQIINQVEVRLSDDVKHIELVNDYMFDNQDCLNDQIGGKQNKNNWKYMKIKNKLFILQNQSLKVIQRKILSSPTIIVIKDEHLINEIQYSQRLKFYQINNLLTGLSRQFVGHTSFVKYPAFSLRRKTQLPNYNHIKFLLIANAVELRNYFDCLQFIFILNLCNKQKCYAQIKVYYLSNSKQQQNEEKKYFFDGENLFICLEIYEYSSKLKKYIILFNKYDLEGHFQFDKCFDSNMVYEWCKQIVANCKFDKRHIYTIPFSIMHTPTIYSTPNSPTKGGFLRSIIQQKCIFNDFQKYTFDQNYSERQFLNSVHKIFRVIGHYVEKFYLVQVNGKRVLLSEIMFKQTKQKKIIRCEFVIVSILAHTVLDMYQIVYYFPKSKRKLMSYIHPLQLQEMDFKDSIILDLLDHSQCMPVNNSNIQFKNYRQIYDYVNSLSKGHMLRKQVQLDSTVLNRLKFIKKKDKDNSPIGVHINKKSEQKSGLAKLSVELLQKNKVIRLAISQNETIAQKVIKFLKFTRNLNQTSNFFDRMLEIKIWRLLQNQIFQLQLWSQPQIQNSSLIERLIESMEFQKSDQTRIIGKQYLLKRQVVENAQFNYKVQNSLTKLYKDLICENQIQLNEDFLHEKHPHYMLRVNFDHQPLLEYLCSIQFKIERLGAAYIECFLEGIKHTSIYHPHDPIPYSNSSNYNIYFRYYCLNNYSFRDVRLNLRELLNLFIADGFFKSQTNYMNSKLSMADVLTMCHYLAFKIKTQNFLNLSQLALQQQPDRKWTLSQYILLKTDGNRIRQKSGEGMVHSQVMKKYLLQFQLFLSMRKVILNVFESKSERFSQKELSFEIVEQEYVPFFTSLLKASKFREALIRLSWTIMVKYDKQNEL